MGMAKRLFKPVPSTDRGEGSGGRRMAPKKQGRMLPPGPVPASGDHPLLGDAAADAEPCSLRLARIGRRLAVEGPCHLVDSATGPVHHLQAGGGPAVRRCAP